MGSGAVESQADAIAARSVIRIRLIGLFEIEPHLPEAAQLPARARAVLALLAAQGGKPMSRSRLAELVWPRSGPVQGKQSLRQALKSIRAAFAAVPGVAIQRDSAASTVWLTGVATDLADLDDLARSPDARDAEAVRHICRGPFLEDFPEISEAFESWLVEERQRVGALAGQFLQASATRLLAAGQNEAAIAAARDFVRLDPLREDARRLLMQAYAAAGRRSEALQQFEDLTLALKQDLNVVPDPATRALAAQIKASADQIAPVQPVLTWPLINETPAPSAAAAGVPVGFLQQGGSAEAIRQTGVPASVRRWPGALIALAFLAFLGIGGGAYLLWQQARMPPDLRPTYAVRPFNVQGAGDKGRQLAAALAARLSNGIAGIPNVRLIAPSANPIETDFRVEGLVAPGDKQTEVQAWIVDGKTGQVFGRTTFKAPPGETAEVQTLILGKIGDDLAVAINRNLYPPPDSTPDHKRARQLAQEARLRIDRKSADVHSTLDLFRQATRLSPDDFEVASWFANALIAEGGSGRASERDRDALYREATELIDQTLQKAQFHRLALYARCQLLRQMNKPHAAHPACEDSNRVLPWSARIHKEVGFIRISLGDLDSALQNFAAADSLEQRLAVRWIWKYGAGLALMLADRNREAHAILREAIALHEESFNAHLVLAVVCSRLGNTDCVTSSISQFRANARQLNLARVLDVILPAANPYSAEVAPKVQQFKAEAMRLLGEQS